mmetsp:Transcript_11159/g.35447  ORF Transcript_11159/g.35447 Transcript_11159/m.35447 type:complete len:121 (+) Transcript_11159:49-411(+)|eukprot:CAMPEP_0197389044 /NCGR_PEP_ID=MMETSP1165-20131217/1411_1 /TAXON_ID=284809 /ORGANISM="Chrysocystis fragilis, Strain CCMP3189" /LENGTH=120 /DNA_ID=CAMNT_0042914411 /DNA_START=42 /DNA_END=407 /DNA_ORIENTATION=+
MAAAKNLLRVGAPLLRSTPSLAVRARVGAPLAARSLATFVDKGEATERIMTVVKNFEKVEAALVSPEVAFKDLSLDSLDVVEVVMAIEEEFAIEIPDAEADKIATISDAVEYISAHPMAK